MHSKSTKFNYVHYTESSFGGNLHLLHTRTAVHNFYYDIRERTDVFNKATKGYSMATSQRMAGSTSYEHQTGNKTQDAAKSQAWM